MKVLAAEAVEGRGAAGEVLDESMTVACGADALRLLQVQKAGKAPVEGAAFLLQALEAIGCKSLDIRLD